jgi:hypothetical protein
MTQRDGTERVRALTAEGGTERRFARCHPKERSDERPCIWVAMNGLSDDLKSFSLRSE